MDSYQAEGDLTDVIRAGAATMAAIDWPGEYALIPEDNNVSDVRDDFGDPFSDMVDPLLRNGPTSSRGHVFSRMLQITTCEPSPLVDPPPSSAKCNGEYKYVNGPGLLGRTNTVDRGTVGMVQISSPRNPSMKRRRSQSHKVVCIPAPAAASGEVVVSDLWAWRKYGQKPIKGSPYPRGYYRCSSSKGCSARKQVERSRTDPNMLVITYTSEHNHPLPTQRNSLAGSTRSTSKAGLISKNSVNSNSNSKNSVTMKHEQNGNSSDDNTASTTPVAGVSSGTAASVKEGRVHVEDEKFVADGLTHCYRPSMEDDFFADLGELDADPYGLLFDQGLAGNYRNRGIKSLDAFNLLDWVDEAIGTSFGDANKKGL